MTLICPVLNLISMFQNAVLFLNYFGFLHIFYLLFCTGHVRGHLNFRGIAIKLFDIVFMFKIFDKSIDMDDYWWISRHQSFRLGPFRQPVFAYK